MRIGAANSATETVEQSLTYCGTEAGKIEAWRSLVQVRSNKFNTLYFYTQSVDLKESTFYKVMTFRVASPLQR